MAGEGHDAEEEERPAHPVAHRERAHPRGGGREADQAAGHEPEGVAVAGHGTPHGVGGGGERGGHVDRRHGPYYLSNPHVSVLAFTPEAPLPAPAGPPRRRPRQARSRQTVARVLDAAAALLEESGHAALTTNEVAARAGVSIGSLYQYFADKDALLAALAERHLAESAERLHALVAELRIRRPGTPAVVRLLVEAAADLHRRDTGLHRALVHDAPRTPALVAELAAFRAGMEAALAELLGELGVPPGRRRLAARVLVTTVDGLVHECLLATDLDSPAEERVEAIVATCTGYLDRARADPGSARPQEGVFTVTRPQ
ncbi:MAG TPA: TetR/AcrR family transcriptional regulator [Pseudonocardia sp.]|nr:TetR/AcrR family transcriptional regulator [Pseudonocardia sp.]